MNLSECMTVAEAARELDLSKSRLEQLIGDGRLPVAGRLGNVRFVLKTRVAELKREERAPGRPRKPTESTNGGEQTAGAG